MNTANNTTITVSTTVNAPVAKVWEAWSLPEHIVKWSTPSPDWHTTKAENDLHAGGKFSSRMEAKDGSFGFDFAGVYDEVKEHEVIAYTLGDGRKANITFATEGNTTTVTETFDPENINSLEMQRGGWQAIIDNFKKYTEAL
jgi:uncharacterized protein YndB with AHSA1/START domain